MIFPSLTGPRSRVMVIRRVRGSCHGNLAARGAWLCLSLRWSQSRWWISPRGDTRRKDVDGLALLARGRRGLEEPATFDKVMEKRQEASAFERDVIVEARDLLAPPLVVDAPAVQDLLDRSH